MQSAVQRARGPHLEPAMRFATDFGKPVTVLGLLLGIAVFGGAGGVETARHALLALASTNLVVEGLKHAVGRERPDGDRKRSNSSFPSSHGANAFALAAVFARRRPRLAPLCFALAAVVAFSRIYLNRHWLSDSLAAAAIGIGCAWLVAELLERRAARRRARG